MTRVFIPITFFYSLNKTQIALLFTCRMKYVLIRHNTAVSYKSIFFYINTTKLFLEEIYLGLIATCIILN